jgi:DNA-binding CsgD family transcriptional regulator
MVKSIRHSQEKSDYLQFLELFRNPSFKSFANRTSQFVTVYNFLTSRYEFVSESLKNLHISASLEIDEPSQYVYAMLTPASVQMLTTEFMPHMVETCEKYPREIPNLSFVGCVQQNTGSWLLLNNHMLEVDDDGQPLLACAIMSEAPPHVKRCLHYSSLLLTCDGATQLLYSKTLGEDRTLSDFSKRELEVLRHLCQGKTSKCIAEELFVSFETIKKHRQNILDKSGCRNTIALINFAKTHGIA